jgi:thioredoxin-like negative regulator of GroEL
VEGFLAQVLQRRANHETFQLRRVDVDRHPLTARRFQVSKVPTLVVIERRRVQARLEAPSGCRQIQEALVRWLK